MLNNLFYLTSDRIVNFGRMVEVVFKTPAKKNHTTVPLKSQ